MDIVVIEDSPAAFEVGGGASVVARALYDDIPIRSLGGMVSKIREKVGTTARIHTLHVFGHGSSRGMSFGDTWVSGGNVGSYSQEFGELATMLAPGATVILHGCEVGGAHDLLHKLAELLGARVEAGTWFQLPTPFIIGPKSSCELEQGGGVVCKLK